MKRPWCSWILFGERMSEGLKMSVPWILYTVGWLHFSRCCFFSFLLSDPAFVGSAYIEESLPKGNLVGDDDKIYFFFSEAGKEFDFFDNTIVSRIARVCKVRDAFRQIVHLKGVSPPPLLKQHLLTPVPITIGIYNPYSICSYTDLYVIFWKLPTA